MTKQELEAIEARAEAATPGPWRAAKDGCTIWAYLPGLGNLKVAGGLEDNDSDFIAHARQDIPALIAEVKRLRKELDAAIEDMAYIAGNETNGAKCNRCKYNPDDMGCELDGAQFNDDGECHFEWHGAENTKEE